MKCISNSSRATVQADYLSKVARNKENFENKDVYATEQYIFKNQKKDAYNIISLFYTKDIRAVSIIKKTKIGMDGLMIQIAYDICTHEDNAFGLHYTHVFFITGMSNKKWQSDMVNKIPICFQENVHHHGQLDKICKKLKSIDKALLIIDEIDTGDKENQKLHTILDKNNLLSIPYLETHDIRFIFVSATMIHELRDLRQWGNKHETYYMTTPSTYIGHRDFLERGIIKEFYPVNTFELAKKWILEDIIDYYKNDYRVHIIRTDLHSQDCIERACIYLKIRYYIHTSSDYIDEYTLNNIFNDITRHRVLIIKGLYRRANLIPNIWKLRIGAIHERYSKNPDTSVQVQGLPGRMTGYWRKEIEMGHKTGPYRTCIKCIEQDIEFHSSKTTDIQYYSRQTKKRLTDPSLIQGLSIHENVIKEPIIKIFSTQEQAKEYYKKHLQHKLHGRGPNKRKPNKNGFYLSTIGKGDNRTRIRSTKEIYNVRRWSLNKTHTYTFHPCYEDIHDNTTLQWWLIYY